MITIKRFMRRSGALAAVIAFGVAVVVPAVSPGSVQAAQLTSRKITLNSSSLGNVTTDINGNNGAAGGYYNGSQTVHTLSFNIATAGAVKSMAIMYCQTPLPQTTCAAPGGMDATSITGISSSGFASNTWTVDAATNATTGYFATGQCTSRTNCVLATQSGATSTAATTPVTITIGSGGGGYIKNPTTAGNYYVRIALFTDTTYTTVSDQGTVAFSVNAPIEVDSAVQENLAFSVSPTFVSAGTPPTCTPLGGGGTVNLGTLSNGVPIVDNAGVYNANSYWRLSTNAANGTTVAYSGDTLKSPSGATFASNTTGFANPSAGTEFFGFNDATANTNASMTNTTPSSNYNTATTYSLTAATTTPTPIATAASGTAVTCDTGSVKYGASASTTTKAGFYKTQLVYYAIPTF